MTPTGMYLRQLSKAMMSVILDQVYLYTVDTVCYNNISVHRYALKRKMWECVVLFSGALERDFSVI